MRPIEPDLLPTRLLHRTGRLGARQKHCPGAALVNLLTELVDQSLWLVPPHRGVDHPLAVELELGRQGDG